MRTILLSLLVVISLPPVLRGQAMTGNQANKIKDEIVKLEKEKASIILKGGSIAADYYDRFYGDDEAYLSSAKGSRTKSDILGDWRAGVPKILSTKHYDFDVRVYDNGNTAVVTYHASGVMQLKDEAPKDYDEQTLEIFVKQDGNWRVVAHAVVDVKNLSKQ
jgi:ketosteroid isomerase-like protein